MSIAVCTRGRPDLLRRALASIAAQSTAPLEIIVIDDATSAEAGAEAVVHEFAAVRHVRAGGNGLDRARNLALERARAPIVAFLDDDAVAAPGWAGHLAAAFRDPRVGACTGRVEPLSLDTPGRQLFEANGGYARGAARIELPRDARRPLHGRRASLIAWAVSIGSGCSMALRREAALAIGGFDPLLDDGDRIPGGGDHDMLWRLLEARRSVVYEPAALAWHEHPAGEREAIAKIAGHQRALIAFLAKSFHRARLRRVLPVGAFLAWRLIKPCVRLYRSLRGQDPLPPSALRTIWRECWRGLRAYPLVQWDARRR